MNEIISRKEAKALGLLHYRSGRPCVNGHDAIRRTTTGSCTQCGAEFRANNKDAIREKKRLEYLANQEKIKERSRQWSKDHPDEKKKRDREHHWANRDRILPQKRDYYQNNKDFLSISKKKWIKNNPDAVKAIKNKWVRANPEKHAEITRNRKARIRGAGGKHTKEDIKYLLEKQKHKCANCKKSVKKERHIDHIMPIVLGGSNDKKNLQILCPSCNLKKNRKHPITWAQENGRLL